MKQKESPPSAPPATAVTRMELAISTLLRAGILTSLALVLIGVIVSFIRHPEFATSPEVLEHLKSDQCQFPTHLGGIIKGAAAGQGRSIILLGVFVLFLTPVLRVAASIVGYIQEKDWTYTTITSMVLFLLLMSLLLGKAG